MEKLTPSIAPPPGPYFWRYRDLQISVSYRGEWPPIYSVWRLTRPFATHVRFCASIREALAFIDSLSEASL